MKFDCATNNNHREANFFQHRYVKFTISEVFEKSFLPIEIADGSLILPWGSPPVLFRIPTRLLFCSRRNRSTSSQWHPQYGSRCVPCGCCSCWLDGQNYRRTGRKLCCLFPELVVHTLLNTSCPHLIGERICCFSWVLEFSPTSAVSFKAVIYTSVFLWVGFFVFFLESSFFFSWGRPHKLPEQEPRGNFPVPPSFPCIQVAQLGDSRRCLGAAGPAGFRNLTANVPLLSLPVRHGWEVELKAAFRGSSSFQPRPLASGHVWFWGMPPVCRTRIATWPQSAQSPSRHGRQFSTFFPQQVRTKYCTNYSRGNISFVQRNLYESNTI